MALKELLPLRVTDKTYDISGFAGIEFAIMGTVSKLLVEAGQMIGADPSEAGDLVEKYTDEALSGDYKNLLEVSKQYVDFEFIGGNV